MGEKTRALLIEFDGKTDTALRNLAMIAGASFHDWLGAKAVELLEIEGEKQPGAGTIVDQKPGRDIAITIQLPEGYLFVAEKKAAEQNITRNAYVSGLLKEYAMDELWGVL